MQLILIFMGICARRTVCLRNGAAKIVLGEARGLLASRRDISAGRRPSNKLITLADNDKSLLFHISFKAPCVKGILTHEHTHTQALSGGVGEVDSLEARCLL